MTIQEYNSCVKNHADALFRFIFKSMKDKMEAENVVQNTFEKLWVKREDIVFETSKAFIFKVGYNNMIDIIRKQKREVSMDAVKGNRHYTTEHYTGAREVLKTAVDKLPENQKTVLLLRDYEGYDYKSIGELTGMTEGQVKINIFRARQTLKAYIGKMEQVL
jgi:RNA polymerase sigma factor (sigma-70 family)